MTRSFYPAVIILAVVASLGLSARRLAYSPDERDLDAAAAAVRAAWKPGDVVIVEPRYIAGPRQRLGDLALIEPRTLAREDLRRFGRAHLVTVDAIGRGEAFAPLLAELGRQTLDAEYGGVRVRRFDLLAPDRVLFDIWESIGELRVTARYPDGVEAGCGRFERDRWICPRDPAWSYVGRKIIDVDGQPRACVWMHPLHAGGTLRVELPALRYAIAAAGGYGFSFDAAHRAAAPVSVRIFSGGTVIHEARHPVRPGWATWRAPVASGPVAIEVTSRNNGAAHFCTALRLIGGERDDD
jgi:hypothetical protein